MYFYQYSGEATLQIDTLTRYTLLTFRYNQALIYRETNMYIWIVSVNL